MSMPISLPLHRYQGLLWSVDVVVADAPCRFLLDLGAGVTTLDRALATQLGLADRGACTGRRMSGEEIRLRLHDGVALGLAGCSLSPPRIASFDLASLMPADWAPVHGTLALDVLEHVPFTLDLAGDALILESAASLAARLQRGAALDVRLQRQIPGVSLDVMAAVESPRGRLWFELDNSNTGPVVVSPRAAEALELRDGADAATLRVPGLGNLPTAVAVRPIIHDGNLGRSVLDGRALTFDLANGQVVARPQNQP